VPEADHLELDRNSLEVNGIARIGGLGGSFGAPEA